jgi:hypothetical protein
MLTCLSCVFLLGAPSQRVVLHVAYVPQPDGCIMLCPTYTPGWVGCGGDASAWGGSAHVPGIHFVCVLCLQWAGMCRAVGTVGSKGIVWPMCSLVRLKKGSGWGVVQLGAPGPSQSVVGRRRFLYGFLYVPACMWCFVACPHRGCTARAAHAALLMVPATSRVLSVCRTCRWHSRLAGPASSTTQLAWQCLAPCLALCSNMMQQCQNVTASCCMPLRPPQECKHAARVLWVVERRPALCVDTWVRACWSPVGVSSNLIC